MQEGDCSEYISVSVYRHVIGIKNSFKAVEIVFYSKQILRTLYNIYLVKPGYHE